MKKIINIFMALFLLGAIEAKAQPGMYKCTAVIKEKVSYQGGWDSTVYINQQPFGVVYQYHYKKYPTGGYTIHRFIDKKGEETNISFPTAAERNKYQVGKWYYLPFDDQKPPAKSDSYRQAQNEGTSVDKTIDREDWGSAKSGVCVYSSLDPMSYVVSSYTTYEVIEGKKYPVYEKDSIPYLPHYTITLKGTDGRKYSRIIFPHENPGFRNTFVLGKEYPTSGFVVEPVK